MLGYGDSPDECSVTCACTYCLHRVVLNKINAIVGETVSEEKNVADGVSDGENEEEAAGDGMEDGVDVSVVHETDDVATMVEEKDGL
jgi:hypothetical protein